MKARHSTRFVAAIAGSALLMAACGGGGGDESASTTPASTAAPASSAPASTDVLAAGGAVSSIDEAKAAVVQVLASGTFRDPAEGTTGFHGSGSGFVIDPSGIVVTNNHVVTGAGAVKVRVGGSDEEVPAKVLGVSECSDIAVLQLVDPGPYPYVQWHDGAVSPPLDVYAAGFPLGDPEYTVTRGVVSKAEADGQTSWASVRRVIEHDANIQPGNSGGPLFDEQGRVVGVNYAGGDPGTGTSQFFAISPDLVRPLVEQLRNGDAETIGVNGQAIVSDDGSSAGIWVGGVAAGSPAADAGVLPGDIITSLNGVAMTPYTFEGYCDVLRTADAGDAISIEVVRSDTQEVWAGELNGTPMELRYSFADELGSEVDDSATGSYTYEQVTDDTGAITVNVPVEWADRATTPSDLGLGELSPSIMAAPDIDGFLNTFGTPGMLFVYAPSGAGGTADELLDQLSDPSCTEESRDDYADPVFTGRQLTMSCEGGALLVVVAGSPNADPSQTVIVGVQVITSADLEALDEILYSFDVVAS